MNVPGQYCYLISSREITPIRDPTSRNPRPPSPPPPRPPSPLNGVTLLPYGTINDLTLPRGENLFSTPYLACTVMPLFLGDRISTWGVHNLGYIFTHASYG
jgi:hypothetical protein